MARSLAALLMILLSVGACGPAALARPLPTQPPPPRLSQGVAAILMDWETGNVLYEKMARQRRDPASTTKVMTAILALERGRLSDQVKVSRRAAYTGGSTMGIKSGEVYSLHDLLHGLLLRSGNDAAVAIAEHLAGSVEAFADLMNQRAQELGARSSHFVNPHGLTHSDHYSTAYDLAVLTRHALSLPWFAGVVALKQQPLTYEQLDRDVVLHNTNRLLHTLEGADGVKTGTTAAAGPCLIASATRDEQRLVAVVLKASNRWRETAELLEWGFLNYRLVYLGRAGEVLTQVPVQGGRPRTVGVALARDAAVILPRSLEQTARMELEIRPARAPLERSAHLGSARIMIGGDHYAEIPLIATAVVVRRTWWEALIETLADGVRILLGREML